MSEPPVFEHARRTDSLAHCAGAGLALAIGVAGIAAASGHLAVGPPDVRGVAALLGIALLPAGLYGVYRVVRPTVYRSRLSGAGVVCTVNGRTTHRISRLDMRTFVYKTAPRVEVVEIYLKDGTSERVSVWYFDVDRLREQLLALGYPLVWKPAHWTREYLTTPDADRATASPGRRS